MRDFLSEAGRMITPRKDNRPGNFPFHIDDILFEERTCNRPGPADRLLNARKPNKRKVP